MHILIGGGGLETPYASGGSDGLRWQLEKRLKYENDFAVHGGVRRFLRIGGMG